MKRLIPYVLFSAATLHTAIGFSPVVAMGCGLHSQKTETVCERDDLDCQNTNIKIRNKD